MDFICEGKLKHERDEGEMGTRFRKVIRLLSSSIERNTQYIEPRIMIISVIAVIGFPLYYLIWRYVFPQPYENLPLRLFGAMLFVPSMFVKRWPKWMSKYKSIYWYLATLYTLSFFFVFMLLKNDGSIVWLLSTLSAVFLMLLWLDWVNVIIQLVVGVLLALIGYYLTTDAPHINLFMLEQIPIYFFVIVVGVATNYSSEMLRKERMKAMLATAGNVAHELRTPLLGIRSGAAGLQQFLPALLDAYKIAKEHGLPVEQIRQVHLGLMHGVLDRIKSEADHSNTIIDMLLMNARMDRTEIEEPALCSMMKCIETAIQRYPFSSERDRQLVVVDGDDFEFSGSEILMVHVLFNLLKNSLYYVAKAGKGGISINMRPTFKANIVIFRDTGMGIPPEVLPHIFTRFYTWSPDSNKSLGAGIGLAFCRSVMSSFGGSISCQSVYGEYTEFTLEFPISRAQESAL